MSAPLVIEQFEIVKQPHLRFAIAAEALTEFTLNRREETLHDGVIVAIAAPAHAAHDATSRQEALVILARVRAALVGMMQQADLGTA